MVNYEVKFFKALGHPIRLKIVIKLIERETCVCELKEQLEFSQSNLSQHLKILRDAGIVTSRKKGMWVHYSIYDDEIKNLLKSAEGIIKKRLDDAL